LTKKKGDTKVARERERDERGRVRRHGMYLSADVKAIVHLPINSAHCASGVKETLQQILQDDSRTTRDANSFDRFGHGVDDVWRRLKNIWPHIIEEMNERVFTSQTEHSQTSQRDTHTCAACEKPTRS